MAKIEEKYMPYAFVGNVFDVIKRLREVGLPNPLTVAEVTRVGVSEGNASRTVAALQFLGLIDKEGRHTESLQALERARTEEYPEILAEVLRSAYADIFKVVNPATATEVAIDDAFRGFNPSKQRKRMASLFIGLCQEAGIREGQPVTRDVAKERDPQDSGRIPPTERGRKLDFKPRNPSVEKWISEIEYILKKLPEYDSEQRPSWTKKEHEAWVNFLNVWLDMNIDVIEE